MNTTGQDSVSCQPAEFDIPTGADVDLTQTFSNAAFGGQAFARSLWNCSGDTVITVQAINRLNKVVVGGSTDGTTLPFSMQPGAIVYGNWTKIVAAGSSYTAGQLKARA